MSIAQSVRDIMRNFHNTNADADLKGELPVYPRTSRIKDFYQNYPFIVVWDNNNYRRYVDESGNAMEWCSTNCSGKYTSHIHRVVTDSWSDEWVFNEMGGTDICFWAFTDEQDALMFSLKWK